jgi:hypothetical protein
MKGCAITIVMLLVAIPVLAGDGWVSAPGPASLPSSRYDWYCQTTTSSWNAFNASSAFGSEMADDVPVQYAGYAVTEVTFYVAQWGYEWSNPTSITVNFYNTACPPGATADVSFEVPWSSCTVSVVYSGDWEVRSVFIPLPGQVEIGQATSIGGVVNQNWGQVAPYCGLVLCDTVTGCEGYWAGDYWGYPRWTPYSYYFGYGMDLAYCLGGGGIGHDEIGACCFADGHCETTYESTCDYESGEYQGNGTHCDPNPCEPSPAKTTTWGQIKGDYR